MNTSQLAVGVQLPEVEYRASWTQIRALAVTAEAVGLDSIWLGEHLLYDDDGDRKGPWECWSMLAALAAVTERVMIGPLVSSLPFHHPALLAKTAATVDEISDGRLILGLGAGWNRTEFDAFGIPYDDRVDRFEEALPVVVRLLAGERVTHSGRYVELDGAELLPAPRPGGLPIMIGSNGPRMLSIALPHATHWNTWYADFDNDPDRLAPLVERIDRAWQGAGRGDEHLIKSVALHVSLTDGPRSRPGRPIEGSDEEVADRLRAVASHGIEHVQMILDPIVPEAVERAGSIRRLLEVDHRTS